MCHRTSAVVALVLACAGVGAAASETASSADLIAVFRNYEALNDDFISSVQSGIGKSGKSYAQLRQEAERYAEGPFVTALLAATEIVCTNRDSAVVQSLFHVTAATTNSANECPADTLGRIFACQPQLVSSEFRKLSSEAKSVLFELLRFGFDNAVHDSPPNDKTIAGLRTKLNALDPNAPQ